MTATTVNQTAGSADDTVAAGSATVTGTVVSADGTVIAYRRVGRGPAVIIVDGALCHRGMGPGKKMAAELASEYTVYTYDRRGRGESGDNTDLRSYEPEREIEDVAALVERAGGSAYLLGFSSGAMLAVRCAARIPGVAKAALYEAPFIVDDTREPAPAEYVEQLTTAIEAGRPGRALKTFMRLVGLPGFLVALFPVFPGWSKMKKVAHTLVYDAKVMGGTQSGRPLPADGPWASVTVPTIVFGGGKSPEWMRNAAHALADRIESAQHHELAGQNHMVKAKALAPVLAEFFAE